MISGLGMVAEVCQTEPFPSFVTGPSIPAIDDLERDSPLKISRTSRHPVGTCAIGDDLTAVVDPELQVRGVEGLRIVDASILPTIARGNANASNITIAERAAVLIREL